MTGTDVLTPKVAIVGGGPAGLTCATRLARRYGKDVLVIEREQVAGGIPRHSDHTGYGIRDLRTVLTGPAYAKKLVAAAQQAGASVAAGTQVTGWGDGLELEITSPNGRQLVRPEAVVLATGARERPRAARRIPGDRPGGVLTTGQLQNLVHLHDEKVGSRAVVIGAELVSWSAVMTLREAGCSTVALVSQYPRPEAYSLFTHPGKMLFRTKVITRSRVVAVHGRGRVSGVEIEDLATGARQTLACDTVVFTGDWIPDHELARLGGLELELGSKSPRVDSALRTSRAGVFAAGNLLHPVETADCAALDGSHVADQVIRYLDGVAGSAVGVRLRVDEPLRWVAPSVLRPGDPLPPRGRLVLWTDEYIARPTVTLRQGHRIVASSRLPWPAAPGRAFRVPAKVLRDVDRSGEDVWLSVS